MSDKKPAEPQFQLSLGLIEYPVQDDLIHQRIKDGYVNATAMCRVAGKKINDYARLQSTNDFLDVLSSETGIPVSELVESVRGGVPELQGTWVHPQVAINLAQWLSPLFAVKVSKLVFDWMSGNYPGGALPYHLRRYMDNLHKIPNGYFSMLGEMTIGLIGPLEQLGYVLPDTMVPDISEGRMFSSWLRAADYDPDAMPSYTHRYEDGREVSARLYPIELLPAFRKHFAEVWMVNRARQYFAERDKKALGYIEKVLALPAFSGRPIKADVLEDGDL